MSHSRNAISQGFKNTGNNAIRDILKNCVYAGLIWVPQYKNLAKKYVKALHTPIISEVDFWRIQKLLKNKRKHKIRDNEDFPLRGVVKCLCGQNLTAGWTTARTKPYIYYKCRKHPGTNIPGNEMHKKFEDILKTLTLQEHQVTLLHTAINKNLKVEADKGVYLKSERSRAIKLIDKKMLKLEEKFITDQISKSVCREWTKKFTSERLAIQNTLQRYRFDIQETESNIEKQFTGRINLYRIYRTSDLSGKHSLIRLIFKDELRWQGRIFTSSYFNEFIQFNLSKQSLRKNLLVKNIFITPVEVIDNNHNNLAISKPIKRRARRVTDVKENLRSDEHELKSIDILASIMVGIINNKSLKARSKNYEKL